MKFKHTFSFFSSGSSALRARSARACAGLGLEHLQDCESCLTFSFCIATAKSQHGKGCEFYQSIVPGDRLYSFRPPAEKSKTANHKQGERT
jgi:hypothetical protein